MTNIQIALLIIRVLLAIKDRDDKILDEVVIPAVTDELGGTSEENKELVEGIGKLFKGLFGEK